MPQQRPRAGIEQLIVEQRREAVQPTIFLILEKDAGEISRDRPLTGLDLHEHGLDFGPPECRAVGEQVTRATSPESLTAWHAQWRADVADTEPTERLHTGSGRGAVESMLRGSAAALPRGAVPFPDVDDDSAPARALLAGDRERLHGSALMQSSPH